MEVIFLGTGTIYPDPARRAPGLALLENDLALVFDSGPGTWFRLAEAGLDFRKLDAIFYTHLHLDHILDWPAYLFLTRNPDFTRDKDLAVFAPQGFNDYVEALQKVFGHWLTPPAYQVKLTELDRKPASFNFMGLTVRVMPVEHTDSSLAYRVEGPAGSAVIGGDLAYCPEIVELARAADLLVLESAHPESAPHPGHLVPSQAGRIAKESGAGKLALTHFYPDCRGHDMAAPAQKEFSGEVIAARDLLRVKVR